MKIVILEDESFIAKELVAKLKEVCPHVEVLEILPSLKAARKWLSNHSEPDCWLMDIQLGDGVSFELFENAALNAPVIFTTAYDEYALQAFKANGIDYLLKPVEEKELQTAMEKAERWLSSAERQLPKLPIDWAQILQGYAQPQYKERILVKQGNQWISLPTKDIAFIFKEKLIFVYSFSSNKYLLDLPTLEEAELVLNPQVFYRANRQHIININSIATLKYLDTQKVAVTLNVGNKQVVEISRDKAPSFRKWLEQ